MRDGNVKRRLILEAEDCCIPTLTPPADRRRTCKAARNQLEINVLMEHLPTESDQWQNLAVDELIAAEEGGGLAVQQY